MAEAGEVGEPDGFEDGEEFADVVDEEVVVVADRL